MTTEKIFIGIDNERIELTGVKKDAFLEARRIEEETDAFIRQEQIAKQAARESALAKLAALGLTEEEIAAL